MSFFKKTDELLKKTDVLLIIILLSFYLSALIKFASIIPKLKVH